MYNETFGWMKYELGYIEILVRQEILSQIQNQTPDQQKQTLLVFNDETQRIKVVWKNEVFASSDERSIERYIQDHQKVLIELTDAVLEHIGRENAEIIYTEARPGDFQLHKIIYKGLEDLLAFIEKYFSKYFNLEERIPGSYASIATRDIRESITTLQTICTKRKMNKKFCAIFMDPIYKFATIDEPVDITFRYVIYIKAMVAELIRLSTESEITKQAEAEDKISDFLCYMNFNSLRYFKYCTDRIATLVDREETLASKLQTLAYEHKLINQKQVKPGFIYDTSYRPLKEQLSDWIVEEMNYLEKKQQLILAFPTVTDKTPKRDFKLMLDMSVSQFACFIRSMIEAGIIHNKNITEVIRFFSGFVRTKRSENISQESFRMKYYNIEHSTRQSLKEILLRLVNNLN